jgi:hypothetical protein
VVKAAQGRPRRSIVAWAGGLALLTSLAMVDLAAPAGACSMDASIATFIGPVLSKGGGGAEFRVDRVLHVTDGEEFDPKGSITVDYWSGDEQFLEVGERYRVSVWSDREPSPAYGSGVHRAGENCGGGGTLHADGSSIDTALALFGIRLWPTGALALGVLAVAVVVVKRISRRRSPEAVQ